LSGDADVGQGYNWLVFNWPYVLENASGTVAIVSTSSTSRWFVPSGGGYVGLYGNKGSLSHDTTNHLWIATLTDGTRQEFHDSDQNTYPQGAFARQVEAGGAVTEVYSYAAGGQIEEIRRSGTVGGQPLTEAFVYVYDSADRTTSVTLRRQLGSSGWEDVLRAAYEYYDGLENFGSLGDLKRIRRQVPTDSGWSDAEITYYRYYVPGEEEGFVHGLKFVVEPATYAKMVAASLDPLTVSNSILATYADNYFEFDGLDRVVLERIDGGSRTFTFAYTSSGFADGSNSWKTKTVETQPDGTQNVAYTNFLGQGMLFLLRAPGTDPNWKTLSLDEWDALSLDEWSELDLAGTQEWPRYTRFNDDNQSILFAYPSAVAGYDEGEADLGIDLRTNAGLIELTEYYDTTGGGAAEGYVSARKIQNGTAATPVLLQSLEYSSQTAGDTTIYPFSKSTVYRNDNGTGAIETSYAYTYHSGTTQIQQRTTTWPVIPTDQNGSGVAATRKDYFDIDGRPTWSMDERGYITHRVYDLATGAIVQQIQDVDTSIVSGAPSGWTTPGDGGKNLITDYLSDDQGRTTQMLGPIHTIDIDGTATAIRRANWTVYDDVTHITYSGQGYQSGTSPSFEYTLINPVSITKQDSGGKVLEQIQAISAETGGTLAEIIADAGGGAVAFPQSSYSRWTTSQYIDCCLAVSQRLYHTIPASGIGLPGTNYDQTNYGYDVMKRRNRTVTPGGTIARQVFDARGQAVSIWIGTNDSGATMEDPSGNGDDPANNMVVITSHVYDNDESGLDGNLTQQTQHLSALEARITTFVYDWRNRQIDTDGEIDFFQRVTYDNLGRVIQTQQYDTTAAGSLIGQNETKYDDRGRVFRMIQYGVNPSTGVVGNSLTGNAWFNAAGNIIKSLPPGANLFKKAAYDSLGRRTTQYLGYDLDETSYADVGSVMDDTILEQSESIYDGASSVIETITRQRYHNAPADQTGPLGDPVNAPKARVTYAALYPDALGRTQAAANYGTNGGTTLTRSSTIPTPSDEILVSLTAYDEAGNTLSMADPSGMVIRMRHDDVGRVVERIQNYQEAPGSSSSSSGNCSASDDINVTVQTTYNADGNVATLAAINAETGNQVTTYVYGTTLSDSAVACSLLKRKEAYPDSVDDGDTVRLTYNCQSQVTTRTDQNGTVHSYDYDALGRIVQDRVTTVGTGVDGTIRRIGMTYEVRGLRGKVTSYDNATVSSGAVLNEVQSEYDDFGQLVTEYQAHGGVVNTSTTPKIQYGYADGSDNTTRQTSLVYPNGRELTYSYATTGSMADAASRVSAIVDDDDTHLVDYEYLGFGTSVVADDTEPQVKWTLVDLGGADDPDTGDIYSGLDRFGRVKDNRWYNYDVEEDVDRLQYGYDRASNRLWRSNLVAQSLSKEFDELYRYDGIHRLKDMGRGLLNGTQTALASQAFAQCWTLDSTGNWFGMKEADTGSAWTLEQTRTASEVNEITNITNTVGSAWAQPAYDAAGNMITMPQPNSPGDSFQATYDAWNRLVQIEDIEGPLQKHQYDGRKFRIMTFGRPDPRSSPSSEESAMSIRHHYFSNRWQAIEERADISTTADLQFVWGLRYIDEIILRDEVSSSDVFTLERTYAIQDPNWNVVATLGSTGSVQSRYVYTAYGTPIAITPDFNETTCDYRSWTVLFTGLPFDPCVAAYLARNRWLSPTLGSWTSRDPIGYANGPNLLSQMFTINSVDPSGLVIIACDCRSEWDADIAYVDCDGDGDRCCSSGCAGLSMNYMGTFQIVPRPERGDHDVDDYFRKYILPTARRRGASYPDSYGIYSKGCQGIAACRANVSDINKYPSDYPNNCIPGTECFGSYDAALKFYNDSRSAGKNVTMTVVQGTWAVSAGADGRFANPCGALAVSDLGSHNFATLLCIDAEGPTWEWINHGWLGGNGKETARVSIGRNLPHELDEDPVVTEAYCVSPVQ